MVSAFRFSKVGWLEIYPEPPLSQPSLLGIPTPWVSSASDSSYQSRVPSVPLPTVTAIGGFWQREFKNNLFITPKRIDLEFVVGPSVQQVEIWSTYTVPLTLSEIIKSGAKGMVINGPKPGDVLAPYGGHWQLTLDVSLDVEMIIDASFEWRFNHGAVTTCLSVTGTKVALWPYPPVYPVSESWQWFTAVIETRSGEQRLSNADRPIQHLDYRYNLPVRVAAEQTARYEAQGQNRHVVPVWTDATSPVSVKAGDSVIQTEVAWRDFNDDGMAVVYKDAEQYEVAFISRVSDNALVLKRPLTFDRSNAVVMPLIAAIAPDGLQSVRRGARTEQQISWVNSQPLDIAPPAVLPVELALEYLGKPVVVKRGKSGGVRDNMAFSWRDKTTASGQQMMIAGRDFGQHTTTIEWAATGRESSWQLRQFLYLFKGRLNTCWWVSFNNEIRLAGKGNRKRIVVQPAGFASFGGRHVYLQWRDGVQMVFARPDGVDAEGNEILDIGGDGNIPVESGDLLGGHVMRLMRPDDDQVKISYQPRHLMKVSMQMKEVPAEEIAG